MGQRRRLIVLLLMLWLVAASLCATAPGRFVISQVSVELPAVTVYVDALDEDGQPLASLTPSELSASIQGEGLKVTQVTSFDASNEGVAYILLVDISKSIGGSQFKQIQQAIDGWIDGLKNTDRMAIFSFGVQYKQVIGFTGEKAALKNAVKTLKSTDAQTKLYLALNNAMNLSRQTTAGLPNRRAIVVLSDGKDEGSAITVDDVREVIQQSHVPIYAIGYSRLPASERQQYLDVMSRFATLSGGMYSNAGSLKTAYEEMQTDVRRVFVVHLECTGCRVESQARPLELTLKSGAITRASSSNVDLVVSAPVASTQKNNSGDDNKGAGDSKDNNKDNNNDKNEEPWWKFVLSWKVLVSVAVVVVVSLTVVFRVQIKHIFGGGGPEQPKVTPVHVDNRETTPAPPPVATPAGRRVQLTVVAGSERGRVQYINLAGKAVIGRDRSCDVSFPDDAEMSARHCELGSAGKYVEAVDLGSSNGTLLNGAKLVTRQRLEDGDLLRAGRTEFRINFA